MCYSLLNAISKSRDEMLALSMRSTKEFQLLGYIVPDHLPGLVPGPNFVS